ncbi:glycosyltransferase [Dongia sedimenti]|uniref:Chitooligosaccharide deacetylase n=1 Tax=Dongia sedimenti TaxID=3064282 RepID=A0ABU0YSM1_9PROT|nr:glycosyltransferase [Rhodospirillaceae bacterium R-7]
MSLKAFGRRNTKSKTLVAKPLPVFFDPTSRRRSLLRILGSVLLLAFLVWSIAFGASLYALAKLTAVDPHGSHEIDPSVRAAAIVAPPAAGGPLRRTHAGYTTVYAYLPFQPEWSYLPLAKALPRIGVLLPEWYRLDLDAAQLSPLGFEEPHQRAVAELLRGRPPNTLLPVASLDDTVTGAQLAAALRSPQVNRRLALSIAQIAAERDYGGLCLNLSGIAEPAYAGAARLFATLHEAFAGTGRKTCLVAPLASSIWDYAPLIAAVDRAVVLGFRDPRTLAAPTPLAPRAWFARRFASLLETLDSGKVVVALGAMGYDWTDGASFAAEINYAEAMRLAGLQNAAVTLDKPSLNTTFSYADGGRRHRVWLLDAVSAYNHLLALSDRKLGGIAVWPLTGADPAIWDLVTTRLPVDDPGALLGDIDIADYVGYQGAGPFQQLLRVPQSGIRAVEIDPPSQLIVDAAYSRLPQPYTIQRYGAGAKGTIALTFDDGPDPHYTEDILDILKANQVPGTFFVVGKNAMRYADLVERMAREGHEVGVHTFFHPVLERSAAWRIRFEVNATGRLIASLTGRQSLLFRAPYGFGHGPLTGIEESPMRQIEQYGYAVVGSDVTPRDWTSAKADDLVAAILPSLNPASGTVIQLHDAGGDRAATVKALPRIIETLRREGYRFVPLGAFIGKTRDQVMPVDDSVTARFDAASFTAIRWAAVPFTWLFMAVTILASLRAVIVIVLAHLRKPHAVPDGVFAPPVTVVVAAYCEEPVIARTLTAVLASNYPDLRILVVDDGSSDRTAAMIAATCGSDPRVSVLTQANGGKFNALNHAYGAITTDIVIAIDADTIIDPEAIRMLVRHFQDPAVGAVAGNVKVGNRQTLMTRLQSLEYVTAQNIDRRAAEVFNGIMVVPGAIGAWRRAAVEQAGYYSSQTLAEDADLTVAIARAGYRVLFEEAALATTEAPETVRQFMRQRLRWMLGMLQTAWKHRGAIAERRWIGLVSIPELFLFSIMVASVAPLVDLMFIAALVDYAIDRMVLAQPAMATLSVGKIAAYCTYLLSDVVVGILAFRLEPAEDKRLLWLLPFQRLFYRQLLYVSAIRALAAALSGRLMRWQKVTRAAEIASDAALGRATQRQIQLTPR